MASNLRESVTPRRLRRLEKYLRYADMIQFASLLLTNISFLSSPYLLGRVPSPYWGGGRIDIGLVVAGWAAFAACVIPTIAVLTWRTDNPTEKRLVISILLIASALVGGFVAVLIMAWGPPEAFAAHLVGPLLLFAPLILRGLTSSELEIRKKRRAPPGQYGNLQGMTAELGVTRRQRFAGMTALGVVITLMALVGTAPTVGPWHDLGESIRRGSPNWALVALFTLVPTLLGIGLGVLSALTKKKDWEPFVLDTFEDHRLWFYHGESLAFFEMENPRVDRLEERTVRITHRKNRWMSVKIRTSTESDMSRLLMLLEQG